MKIILDENMSLAVAGALTRSGHEVTAVTTSGHRGKPDKSIWEIACLEQSLLLTRDRHFTNMARYPSANCLGIIFIRPGNLSSTHELELVQNFLTSYDLDKYRGRLVVLSPTSVQIR